MFGLLNRQCIVEVSKWTKCPLVMTTHLHKVSNDLMLVINHSNNNTFDHIHRQQAVDWSLCVMYIYVA